MPDVKYAALDISEELKNFDLEPFGERLVVKELEVESVGRLLVPETARDKEMQTNLGYVIAMGPLVETCVPGDLVYYGRYSGAKFTWNDKKYRIMNEDDLLGKVKE